MKLILVASGDSSVCDSIRDFFGPDYRVDAAHEEPSLDARLSRQRYEFVIADVALLRSFGREELNLRDGLRRVREASPLSKIILLTSKRDEDIRESIEAVRTGTVNYLTYPISLPELKFVTEQVSKLDRAQTEIDYLRGQFWDNESLEIIRTHSPEMSVVYGKIRSVAPTRTSVLLSGETGTGKGVIAKLIHRHSNRRNRPFIAVHCGAIPDTLIESEIFGHERGSFTGALRRKLGKFEIAQGGTLFLDEISTITPPAQVKLLQVLQDRRFQRVGGEVDIVADVRIIAATNVDLMELCNNGTLRKDLYYRLNVFPITIPPLRERVNDLPMIAALILKRLNSIHTKSIAAFEQPVLEALMNYSWPGNVRELENIIERAYILESSSTLTTGNFPEEFFHTETTAANLSFDVSMPLTEVRRRGIDTIEHRYISELLTIHGGSINRTARAAGISVRQLHKIMTKRKLRKENFRRVGPL